MKDFDQFKTIITDEKMEDALRDAINETLDMHLVGKETTIAQDEMTAIANVSKTITLEYLAAYHVWVHH